MEGEDSEGTNKGGEGLMKEAEGPRAGKTERERTYGPR